MAKAKNKHKAQTSNKSQLYFSVILFVISFILYTNTIGHDYSLDDLMLIKENRFTLSGFSGIPDILTQDMFSGHNEGYKTDLSGGRYRPLSQITFAIEHELFGLNPHLSHFLNVLIFSLTPVLIFIILNLLIRADLKNFNWFSSIPFLAALFYAVHPIHTEAIANIKGRDELMSMLIVLISFYYFIKFTDTDTKKYLIYSLVAFFAALLSKENAITYLAVMPLSLIMFREKNVKNSLKSILPFLAVAVVFILIRQSIVGGSKVLAIPELMNEPFAGMDFTEKYGTIFYTLLNYIKLQIVPYPLTYDYYPYHIPKTDLITFLPFLALAVHSIMIYFAFKFNKESPIVSFAIFYYFITLSIASNLLFTIGSFMNERFVYMPSLAVSIILAWFLGDYLYKKLPTKKIVMGIVIAIVGVYSFMTVTRNPVWKDNFTLMTTDVKTSQNSAFGNFAAGVQYYLKLKDSRSQKDRTEYFNKGIKHLYKAFEIYPRYSNAFLTLGNTYFEYNPNYVDSTILYYTKSLDIYPANYDASLNIARLQRDYRKDFGMSEFYLQNCIKVNPNKWEAYNELGTIYYNQGKFTDAANMFESSLARDSNNGQIFHNLSATYAALGDTAKAIMYQNQSKMQRR